MAEAPYNLSIKENALPQEERDEIIAKVEDGVQDWLSNIVKQRIQDRFEGDPEEISGELLDFSMRSAKKIEEYFSQYDIPPEKVLKAKKILTGRTKQNMANQDLSILDTILITKSEENFVESPEEAKTVQRLSMIHEQYHTASTDVYEASVSGSLDNLDIKLKRVKAGLNRVVDNDIPHQAALEEGMAVRASLIIGEEVFKGEVAPEKIKEIIYQNSDSKLNYWQSYELITELEKAVPDFVRLAERARILDDFEPLQVAVDASLGQNTYKRLASLTIDQAGDVYYELYKRRRPELNLP